MAAVDDDDLIDEERLISLLEFSPDVQEAIDQVEKWNIIDLNMIVIDVIFTLIVIVILSTIHDTVYRCLGSVHIQLDL